MKDLTPIKLDKDEVTLRLTNRAYFRLGELKERPQLHVSHKAYNSLCAWVWALLPRELEEKYPNVTDIIDVVPFDRIEEFLEAVLNALKEGPGKEGSPKNSKPGKKRRSASKPG